MTVSKLGIKSLLMRPLIWKFALNVEHRNQPFMFLEIAFGPKEWSFQHTNFQIQNQANEFFYLCYEEKNHTSHPILISWSPSTQLFIKLNTNDSVMNNPCLVGAGGLMGDLNGKWIWDFSMHLGVTTSVQAEI